MPMIISEAQTAKEFRDEVVNYFNMRLRHAQTKRCTGKERRENETLIEEFKYQIGFWSRVKFSDEVDPIR